MIYIGTAGIQLSCKPDYSLIAREIAERKLDITLISKSPNIGVDVLKFKGMVEKL